MLRLLPQQIMPQNITEGT